MKKMSAWKKGALALALAICVCAGGSVYEVQQVKESLELAEYVDPELETEILDEETPLASTPKVTTTTKTSTKSAQKTVTLSKASAKTYTKSLPTTTKTSTKTTKKNSTTTVKTVTTVKVYTTEKYTKGSKYKVVTTKTVTTVKTTTTVQVTTTSTASSGTKTWNVDAAAPKMDSRVRSAFKTLGFTITIRKDVSYSGYFSAKTKSITIRDEDTTIYHELGHFLAFVAGNYDKTTKFTAVYNAEKDLYSGFNKAYVTQNASEYFAESVRDYMLYNSKLKSERPKTYAAVQEALSKLTTAQINKMKLILSALS